MAPYAVAHMKLGLQLAETGYDFQKDERLRVYLTNTMEEAHEVSRMPLFTQWLAAEANEASRVKQEAPVMVVLGNPPYSVSSQNKGEWISDLIDDYKKDLNERKINLDDDYVKFIRFAQWRIEQTGYGILAFITNHGYLDNPTFRVMRHSLIQTFDDIYLLDLHGNSRKKERSPDGSKDENVFDIQQGVAIGIFVKRGDKKQQAAMVHHSELWGAREVYEKNFESKSTLFGGKYHWLWDNNIATTDWKIIKPDPPFYLFIPQNVDLFDEYNTGKSVQDFFIEYTTAVQTARDSFAISFSKEELQKHLEDFRDLNNSDEDIAVKYDLRDARDWTYKEARKQLRDKGINESLLIPYLYRPFDERFIYYSPLIVAWPRTQIGLHTVNRDNLVLLVTRNSNNPMNGIALATRNPADKRSIADSRGEAKYFYLYLYPNDRKENLFDEPSDAPGGRRPNLAPEFIADFSGRLQMAFIPDGKGDRVKTFGPEDVFDYMYAVFHSPTYRTRYAEFLKIDFPRLPLTSNAELFRTLCALGSELTGLHLMEQHAPPVAGFPIKGDSTVEAVRYTAPGDGADEGRVWINKEQYFGRVPPEVWNFHVGGYQVCQKWLKDRKGHKLAFDDLKHYQQIVSALSETIRLMAEIDETIEKHDGWPLGDK